MVLEEEETWNGTEAEFEGSVFQNYKTIERKKVTDL